MTSTEVAKSRLSVSQTYQTSGAPSRVSGLLTPNMEVEDTPPHTARSSSGSGMYFYRAVRGVVSIFSSRIRGSELFIKYFLFQLYLFKKLLAIVRPLFNNSLCPLIFCKVTSCAVFLT